MMDLDEIKGILAGEMSNCDEQTLVERKERLNAIMMANYPCPQTLGAALLLSQLTWPTVLSG